jgi:hypothetical protein
MVRFFGTLGTAVDIQNFMERLLEVRIYGSARRDLRQYD